MDDLKNIQKQFDYYKMLGDKTFEQLTDEQLFWQYAPASNSIASIVKHLAGNMRSRWTDFLTSDGEKTWRERETEFVMDIQNRAEMLQIWENGWSCLFQALQSLTMEDLSKLVYIRNMGHTVLEAIFRQLAHYPYHIGQIVYIGKMLRDSDWQSLSIPRGQSAQYNAEKFAQPKMRKHFTEEDLS